MIKGNIYHIMIGCPSDMLEEANIVMECINRWNVINSEIHNIALIPIHWTSASYPSLDKEAQKELNRQLCERSDALICLFGSRLGSATSTHISGTVEEIEEHTKAGKPVMVFFKKLVDPSNDPQQYIKLLEYKTSLASKGLYYDYDNKDSFKPLFSEKLNLLVNDKFASGDLYIESKTKEIAYTDEEINIMKKWCKSNIDLLSIIHFIGNRSTFRFGNVQVETESIKEKAQLENFIYRLENDGCIIKYKLNNQGIWSYKLTIEAFNRFED